MYITVNQDERERFIPKNKTAGSAKFRKSNDLPRTGPEPILDGEPSTLIRLSSVGYSGYFEVQVLLIFRLLIETGYQSFLIVPKRCSY